MPFDPFLDFESKGYLRNALRYKDPHKVKQMEHNVFRAALPEALSFLAGQASLTYAAFLKVHELLFKDFYPWAGQDRTMTTPARAISKAGTNFCLPHDIQRAVEHGLQLGHDKKKMRVRCGEVMGLFAYGHPFLDGNGRTMLLMHTELCFRAGFSINWGRTDKLAYLRALSAEIAVPNDKVLDRYLLQFIEPAVPREAWQIGIQALKGLDGTGIDDVVEGEVDDESIARKYQEFERKRGYSIGGQDAGD